MATEAQDKPPDVGVPVPRVEDAWSSDPRNPLNWSAGRKWSNTLIVSIAGLLSTSGSSMPVPSLRLIGHSFDVPPDSIVLRLTIGLYVLGLGFGPFIFAPVSELFGRKVSYVSSHLGCTFLSLGCALVGNLPGLIVLRFLAGCCASSAPTLGLATVSDCFTKETRGRPGSIYAIGPIGGPALGTLVGSYITLGGWRAVFWSLFGSIAALTVVIVLFLEETYGPVVRRRIEAADQAQPSTNAVEAKAKRTKRFVDLRVHAEVKAVFTRTFTRPPRMLVNPVAALFVTYYSYIYAVIYVALVSIPLLFSGVSAEPPLFNYGWPETTEGLAYIGLTVGFLSAAGTAAYAQDAIYKKLSAREGRGGRPEFRLVLTQIGMLIFPVGILLFGWTAEAQVHWIVPQIGITIFAYGLMLAFNSIQIFLVDAFVPYSAAALAAASFMRSLFGCVLPLYAPELFTTLKWGMGATVLAVVTLPAIPAPAILGSMGERLRKRYVFSG